jgi:hypothetical protein
MTPCPVAVRWDVRRATQDVRLHHTGTKRIHHPVVGDLDLAYEGMVLTADDGLTLNAFTAEPNSASAEALSLLASWVASSGHEIATPDRSDRTPTG